MARANIVVMSGETVRTVLFWTVSEEENNGVPAFSCASDVDHPAENSANH